MPLAPQREHSRRAAGKQPRTGLGEGLVIATWARPPRLTCGATGVSLWAAPGRGETAGQGRFWGRWYRSVQNFSARSGASSHVARWGRGVPAVLGMKLSRLRLVLPRHSKVIENALKNDSIFGADNLQVAADCLCLAATQVALT